MRTWQDDFRAMYKKGVNINSMASVRRVVEDDLRQGRHILFEHLMKLYFYPEGTQYHRGWMTSVYSATYSVGRLKRNNKYPSEEFILDVIWLEKDPPDIERRMNLHVEAMDHLNPYLEPHNLPLDTVVIKDCMKFLDSYHRWLSYELSWNGEVTCVDVHKKLKELLSVSIFKR